MVQVGDIMGEALAHMSPTLAAWRVHSLGALGVLPTLNPPMLRTAPSAALSGVRLRVEGAPDEAVY